MELGRLRPCRRQKLPEMETPPWIVVESWPKLMRAVLSTSKCVARPDIGMLIELALREAIVASFTTVTLDAERPEQTKSEWAVAFVASIVSRGALLVRIMNSSWLGFDTNAACGCVAPTYWNSI